tara:strand:+ start:570 stop:1043 length:474 start_codon:yes stop_codon:yes gene_type:complete
MKINKILTILSFFLLLSCGFEPIYSEKKINKNYNFTINNIGFSGNNNINQYLKNDLIKYQNNKNKEITYDLTIDSSAIKTITTKNKKGDPESFHIKIVINVDIIENNKIKNKTTLEEGFEYKNKSNKFQLYKYEKNIQKNITNKLSKDLIDYLYYIK